MNPPRTAVVTITHRRDDHLHGQRLGLVACPPDLHVVVGMDDTPELRDVTGAAPVLTEALSGHGGGLPLARARNLGAARALDAGADLLVFLDVDCVPGPRLVASYGDAAARVRSPALLCGPVAYLPPPPAGGYALDRLDAPVHPARPAPQPGELLAETRFELFWSLSFAVTAATWTSLDGFCEDYAGYGAEDTDFALSSRAAGAGLYWVGGAEAYHQYHPPTRLDPARAPEIVRNATTFRRRHGHWPMRDWLRDLARGGVVEFDPDRDLLRLVAAKPF
ncbi:glycosyltransferase family 2 protein [Actinokineospora globicatena]|uniref:Glycosyl transferase family A n=1 Tax=Actinokineospora globicatena TaxID=103729 RepID=A0A9W6QEW4_9PSEU|nr:glycosyltransferase family 2 protein [Actinokineospora globicatena]GLW89671.1 glycosyl transferase family A [Actinokineospora globicatena]